MRKSGIGLLVAAYVLLLYTSVAAPGYAHAHSQLGAAMLAAYAAPWPVALACVVGFNGLVLALIPIRRGEKWAFWLSAVTLLILLVTRLATDARCLVVLDPHQHGCHTFMICIIFGLAGLVLAAPRPSTNAL
jgi:hypothetical protein